MTTKYFLSGKTGKKKFKLTSKPTLESEKEEFRKLVRSSTYKKPHVFFGDVSDDELDVIFRNSETVSFKANRKTPIWDGQTDKCYIVRSGRLAVERNGQTGQPHFVGCGYMFGAFPRSGEEAAPILRVTAVESSQAFCFNAEDLKKLSQSASKRLVQIVVVDKISDGAITRVESDDQEPSTPEGGPIDEPVLPVWASTSRRTIRRLSDVWQPNVEEWASPVFSKTIEESEDLKKMLKESPDIKIGMLLQNHDEAALDDLVDAFETVDLLNGDVLMSHGDEAVAFYVLASGCLGLSQFGETVPSSYLKKGCGFGERSLLGGDFNTETVTAVKDSKVWKLEKAVFNRLILNCMQTSTSSKSLKGPNMESALRKLSAFCSVIQGSHSFKPPGDMGVRASRLLTAFCGADQELESLLMSNQYSKTREVFDASTDEVIKQVVDVSRLRVLADRVTIMQQGREDKFCYIVKSGKFFIRGYDDNLDTTISIQGGGPGCMFGDAACIAGLPSQVTVETACPSEVWAIDNEIFLKLLGSAPVYSDRRADAVPEHLMEQFPPDSDAGRAVKLVSKFLDWATLQDVLGNIDSVNDLACPEFDDEKCIKKQLREQFDSLVKSNATKEPEPQTLAERTERDFQNPEIVQPCYEFHDHKANIVLYGGLRLGEKFTEDKHFHTYPDQSYVIDGAAMRIDWQDKTPFSKNGASISVVSQKGQKAPSDPTPNQDNYFIRHSGDVRIYGVLDGHGPFGHVVSFRLAQTLPHYILENVSGNWQHTLEKSFALAQEELIKFCHTHNINTDASGAACSVLVNCGLDIHIAYIGDAKIMVANWSKKDSKVLYCTKEHLPNDPEERERLEKAGSEVREVDPGNFRIFLRGKFTPGLAMSRAFGDTACEGISRVPACHKMTMGKKDQWYAVIASDGIWEFMEPDHVLQYSAKKMRVKGTSETVNFLVQGSRKRWAQVCDDYCDDITAMICQWNPICDDMPQNHCLRWRPSPAENIGEEMRAILSKE